MRPFKYSYFQLTFGQEEAYLYPERTYKRLQRFGYDAIEICPPKGRYGLGVGMEQYLETHKQLKADFGLEVSCINECWGEEWDPYSPTYKTLTDPETAELAVRETKSTIDFAAELDAPVCHHRRRHPRRHHAGQSGDATAVAVDALQRSADYAASQGTCGSSLRPRITWRWASSSTRCSTTSA